MNLSAIILAAGAGERFGKPKLLIQDRADNFYVHSIIDKLHSANVKDIVMIIRRDELEWTNKNITNINVKVNPAPSKGMISSISLGIKNISEETDGVFIYPIDHPYVQIETLLHMSLDFKKSPFCIIKPSFEFQAGHPIILPKSFITEFENFKGSTLYGKIKDAYMETVYTKVYDEGILKNVNYISDL